MIPRSGKVEPLLASLAGIDLVALARPDECCGFGGTFAVAEEAVSCMMGRDRIADHARAGAEVVTATDVSCLMHLSGLARRDREALRFMHVAEIFAEAMA
jgi:L-lactate dehydrogenase complex protein LldE